MGSPDAYVNKTKRQCVVHHKLNPNFGTVAEQVASLERLLRSKVHGNANVLREWCKKLRIKDKAYFNGKVLGIHFVLPKELFEVKGKQWVSGTILTRNTLPEFNQLKAWHDVFERFDGTSTLSDLLTRLIFLINGGKNYLAGLSLRDKADQYKDPPAAAEWLCPRQGVGTLTRREAAMLTQLVFQRQLDNKSGKYVAKGRLNKDNRVDEASIQGREEPEEFDLVVKGLMNGCLLQLYGGTKNNPNLLNNDAKLVVERKNETTAVKQAKYHLNKKLRLALEVDFDLIEEHGNTYMLQIPAFIYIQVADEQLR